MFNYMNVAVVDVLMVSALALALINWVRVWVRNDEAASKNIKRKYTKNLSHPYWAQGRTAYRKTIHAKRKYTKDLSNPRWAK